MQSETENRHDVTIDAGDVSLEGDLMVPDGARGIVVFAHGSGSSRWSPRNRQVADVLVDAGLATLLFDLLTAEEERVDMATRQLRFDIPRLASRLVAASEWTRHRADVGQLPLGLFGASTGAAAALIAASERPELVSAVVSRGGRPDLAGDALPKVRAPTLLIVGGEDKVVIGMNREAQARLQRADHQLEIVPGATHLFEEPGKLQQVSVLARDFFAKHLR